MSLEIELIPVTAFEQNCRIVFDSATKQAVVFDPGGEAARIFNFLKQQQLSLQAVYLTHSHLDHCGGVAALLKLYPAPLFAHQSEKVFRENVRNAAQMYGMGGPEFENCPEPDTYLDEKSEITVLGEKIKIFETPGHSPGSVSFWIPSHSWLLSGDVLFKGSVGRTDLQGGDHHDLIKSINRLMRDLPANARVLSGHGPDTSLEDEKLSNPFL